MVRKSKKFCEKREARQAVASAVSWAINHNFQFVSDVIDEGETCYEKRQMWLNYTGKLAAKKLEFGGWITIRDPDKVTPMHSTSSNGEPKYFNPDDYE